MFNSPWIRKPDYTAIAPHGHNEKWEEYANGLARRLKPRERIMRDLIPAGSSVCVLGSGASRFPSALAEKGCVVYAADISDAAVALQSGAGIESSTIDLEDIGALAALGTYDYVVLSEVLEHLRLPEETVQALRTHAKDFLITVPNSAAYIFRFGLLFRGRFFTQWVRHPAEHIRFWSHTDFLDWLAAMGFEVKDTYVSDGFTCRGLLPWLPRIWKNFFGYRMVYHVTSRRIDVLD